MRHHLGHFPCGQCRQRAHPLDLIANTTAAQREEFEAQAQRAREADTVVKRTSAQWEEYLQ